MMGQMYNCYSIYDSANYIAGADICFFVSPAKHSRDLGIMTPSTASTLAHFWFPIDFVCFVALRLKSTAMVIAGRSVHLNTLFPGQA